MGLSRRIIHAAEVVKNAVSNRFFDLLAAATVALCVLQAVLGRVQAGSYVLAAVAIIVASAHRRHDEEVRLKEARIKALQKK